MKPSRGLMTLFVAVLAVACGIGDDDGLSATEWAEGICKIQSDFETEVSAAIQVEQAALTAAGDDLESQQQALVVLLDTTAAEADTATERLDALGAPDVAAGDEALEVATDRFTAVRAILEEASTRVEALPVADPNAFAVATDAVGTSIGAGFQELAASFSNVGTSEELRMALNTACSGE